MDILKIGKNEAQSFVYPFFLSVHQSMNDNLTKYNKTKHDH